MYLGGHIMEKYNNLSVEEKFPQRLNSKELYEHCKLAKDGDEKAKEILRERNLKLILKLINKYFPNIPDKRELLSTGFLGLFNAVENFNPDLHRKFSTFAGKCILNAIRMELKSNRKLYKITSTEEITKTYNDGNEQHLEECLFEEESLEENIEKKVINENLRKALYKLSEKERLVIELRFGFHGKCYTDKEIGELLNLSKQRICKIQIKAMKILRLELEENGIEIIVRTNKYIEAVKNMTSEEKALFIADIMIKNNYSLNRLSLMFNESVASISYLIDKILSKTNKTKYLELKELQKKEAILNSKNEKYYVPGNNLLEVFYKYTEEEIESAINQLDEVERTILLSRYSLNGTQQLSIKEIAQQFKIKKGSTSYIIVKILNRVYESLEESRSKMQQSNNKQLLVLNKKNL